MFFNSGTIGNVTEKDAGQDCKWEHIRSNHPSAPAYIKAGEAAPTGKAKAKSKAKSTKGKGGGEQEKKPKSQTYCRFLQKGACKKGKDCDYSHDKAHAAPAADLKKERRKEAKARKKAAAGAVETGVTAAGPALSCDSSDCSSSS